MDTAGSDRETSCGIKCPVHYRSALLCLGLLNHDHPDRSEVSESQGQHGFEGWQHSSWNCPAHNPDMHSIHYIHLLTVQDLSNQEALIKRQQTEKHGDKTAWMDKSTLWRLNQFNTE